MKRRTFVAGAGLLAGATVVGLPTLDGSATPPAPLPDIGGSPSRTDPGRIDIQRPVLPPAFVHAMQRQGLDGWAGRPWPQDSAQQLLDALEQGGIQTAITALPAPGVFSGNGVAAAELARRCNEFAAELATAHRGRFGSFASVPLPATEQACAEAIHALDTLQADGITLLASNSGVFLGDPRFDELMAELDKRQARVLVQANLHTSSQQLGLGTPPWLLETVCDITRAAVNLIFTGTLERYPHIHWILADGGGFLPYAAWRISLANALPAFSEQIPQGVMTYLQRFYFSTAAASAPAPMAVLRELVDAQQVLYGTGVVDVGGDDYPLRESSIWTPEQVRGIERGHALRLFPRWRVAGEQVVPAPVHGSETTGQWLGRMATKPIGAVAQRLKE